MTAAPAPTGSLHLSATALLKSAACQQEGTTSIHSPLLLLLPPACLPLLLYIPGRAESPLAPPKPPSPPQELQHLQIPSSPFWVPALRSQNLLFLPRPLLHPWPLNTPQHPGMDGPRSTTLAPTQLQFGYLLHKPDELKTGIKKQNGFFPLFQSLSLTSLPFHTNKSEFVWIPAPYRETSSSVNRSTANNYAVNLPLSSTCNHLTCERVVEMQSSWMAFGHCQSHITFPQLLLLWKHT